MKRIFYTVVLAFALLHPLMACAQTDPMTVVSLDNLKPDRIREIKLALNARGLYDDKMDGRWRGTAAKALSYFQNQNGEHGAYNGRMITLRTLKLLGIELDLKKDLIKQDES